MARFFIHLFLNVLLAIPTAFAGADLVISSVIVDKDTGRTWKWCCSIDDRGNQIENSIQGMWWGENFVVPVEITIENLGDATAGVFKIEAVSSRPGNRWATENLRTNWHGPIRSGAGFIWVEKLAPGESRTFDANIAISNKLAQEIRFIIDSCKNDSNLPAHCRVDETTPANNFYENNNYSGFDIKVPSRELDDTKFGATSTHPHPSIDTDIVGMAISSQGVVTWYLDGTFTIGRPHNLDSHQIPSRFELPAGKDPSDIVAMAIDSRNYTFTWYKNGTRTVGSFAKLDEYEKPKKFKLPKRPTNTSRYTPDDIIDVIIAAEDEVITYFSNYMSAKGTSLNLGKYASNIQYQTLYGLPTSTILGIGGGVPNTGKSRTYTWYHNGFVSNGNPSNLAAGSENPYILNDEIPFPFSQHLTIYSFKSDLERSPAGASKDSISDSMGVLRAEFNNVHEPVLAPGQENIALAHARLSIFKKTGELIMSRSEEDVFSDFIGHKRDDHVRNINSHIGMHSCIFPITRNDFGLCLSEVYDSRAAYDESGGRFIFIANARHPMWDDADSLKDAPGRADCAKVNIFNLEENSPDELYVDGIDCDLVRRNLMIAVSVSEDPADGFHLYAITESNVRDWPIVSVQGDQLIVGHMNYGRPRVPKRGYVALIFNLPDMRAGKKRPRYSKLYKEDFDDHGTIAFPRSQDAFMTIGISGRGDGHFVYGFSKQYIPNYDKPRIYRTAESLPALNHNYSLADGLLRISSTNRSGSENLRYDSYALSVQPNRLNLMLTDVQKASDTVPELNFDRSNISQIYLSRLSVTSTGDEIISFSAALPVSNAGTLGGQVRSGFTYNAGFIARKANEAFFAPVTYIQLGQHAEVRFEPNSAIFFSAQQGAGAADPYNEDRIWIFNHHGLGKNGRLRGVLGWVDLNRQQ